MHTIGNSFEKIFAFEVIRFYAFLGIFNEPYYMQKDEGIENS